MMGSIHRNKHHEVSISTTRQSRCSERWRSKSAVISQSEAPLTRDRSAVNLSVPGFIDSNLQGTLNGFRIGGIGIPASFTQVAV